MKFLIVRNLKNGKRFYCVSRGNNYSPVSPETFRASFTAHFKGSIVPLLYRSRSGPYDLVEFVSGSP